MMRLWRLVLAAVLPLVAALGGLLLAGTAQAQTVANGSLTFSGPKADYITQGESESFSTSHGDPLVVSTTTNNPGNEVGIRVFISASEWWDLEIAAGGTAVLKPGTYPSATRYPFNTSGPGLNLDGNGRGCNTLTGSFTVTDAVFGPQGYVQKFDATFVQHCEGAAAAATGAIHVSNPPPPAGTPSTPANPTSPQAGGAGGPGTTSSGGSGTGSATGGGTAISSRRATSSGKGRATATGNGAGNTVGNAAVDNTGSTTPAALRSGVSVPLLIGVGVGTWVVIAGLALGIGLGTPVRRQPQQNRYGG